MIIAYSIKTHFKMLSTTNIIDINFHCATDWNFYRAFSLLVVHNNSATEYKFFHTKNGHAVHLALWVFCATKTLAECLYEVGICMMCVNGEVKRAELFFLFFEWLSVWQM